MATLESTIESALGKGGLKGLKHQNQLIFDCLMMKQDCFRLNKRKPADNAVIIYKKKKKKKKKKKLFRRCTLFSVVMGVAI